MSDLPLKVRADIRDLWDKKGSTINDAVDALDKALGHKITPVVEWSAIWAECQDLHPDKGTFVPAIVSIATAWYETLMFRLDDDNNADWTDELLNTLGEVASRGIKLLVEARGKSIPQPKTHWKSWEGCFVLGIPTTRSIAIHSLKSNLNADFADIFKSEEEAGLAPNAAAPPNQAAQDDDWSEITKTNDVMGVLSSFATPANPSNPPKQTSTSAKPSNTRPATNQQPERLPSMNSIMRPVDHFQATLPYTLMVDYTRGEMQMIQIFCSHQKTLQLLADYFQRWGTKNIKDSRYPSIVNVQLRESTLCSGIHDMLLIRPYYTKEFEVNPALVITFIEGTLGYQLVHTDGTHWVYRSDRLLL